MKPGDDAEKNAAWGYDVVEVPLGDAILTTGVITATLTAVSRTRWIVKDSGRKSI